MKRDPQAYIEDTTPKIKMTLIYECPEVRVFRYERDRTADGTLYCLSCSHMAQEWQHAGSEIRTGAEDADLPPW